jgi:phosphate transport system permease protein
MPTLPPPKLGDLRTSPKRARRERLVRTVLFGAALVSVLISAAIVISLVTQAWEFIVTVDWSAVWSTGWFPRNNIFDIKTLLISSLIVTAIAMAVAAPLGVGAAIYLSEYASRRARSILKPALEVLAGIPSVVLGFFALMWVSPNVVQNLFSSANRGNLMAAGVGVGVLTIPLVASISEDAMKSVPNTLREAATGLGARKVTISIRVVLPAAVSGLAAAFIVAISRALGETMVVFLAGGAGDTALYTHNPTDGGLTMTAAMASLASGTDNVVGAGLAFPSLYFVGLVLFTLTFGLNIVAARFVRRFREAY